MTRRGEGLSGSVEAAGKGVDFLWKLVGGAPVTSHLGYQWYLHYSCQSLKDTANGCHVVTNGLMVIVPEGYSVFRCLIIAQLP